MCTRAGMRVGIFVVVLGAVLAWQTHAEAQARKKRGSARPPAPAAEAPAPEAASDGAANEQSPAGADQSAPAAPAAGAAPAIDPPAAAPDQEANAAAEAATEEAHATREELATVMDALVSARARAALLGKSLFKTRVRVILENEAADDQQLSKVALALDGNPIYRGEGSTLNPEGAKLFEGYAAPGPHVLTVEIEQRAKEDDAYRYSQTSSLRFVVPRGTLTDLKLVLDDDSDIAEDFADDDEGEYDVRLRLEVTARPLGGS